MDDDEMRARFAAARVARLATVGTSMRPHVVPVCFDLVRDPGGNLDTIVSVVDDKPKTTPELHRLANVRANPGTSMLVDEYDDDWTRLWWVRADGVARVVAREDDPAAHADAVDRLAAKYPQYRERRPRGAVLVIAVQTWRGWAWRPSG